MSQNIPTGILAFILVFVFGGGIVVGIVMELVK